MVLLQLFDARVEIVLLELQLSNLFLEELVLQAQVFNLDLGVVDEVLRLLLYRLRLLLFLAQERHRRRDEVLLQSFNRLHEAVLRLVEVLIIAHLILF